MSRDGMLFQRDTVLGTGPIPPQQELPTRSRHSNISTSCPLNANLSTPDIIHPTVPGTVPDAVWGSAVFAQTPVGCVFLVDVHGLGVSRMTADLRDGWPCQG